MYKLQIARGYYLTFPPFDYMFTQISMFHSNILFNAFDLSEQCFKFCEG